MSRNAAGAAGKTEAAGRGAGVGQAGVQEGSAEKTYTQAELDQAVKAAVGAETAKFADFDKYKAAFDEAKAKADGEKSDLQKAIERAEEAERERDALKASKEQATWIAEASKATGVPEAALHGATKEEIEACAESLKEYFKGSAAPAVNTGDPSQPDDKTGGDPLRELFER